MASTASPPTEAPPAAPERLVGLHTHEGFCIPLAGLMARLGGRRRLNRVLSSLTVRETPQPGRPKMYARGKRLAYKIERGAADRLIVPHGKAPAFARHLDGVALAPALAAQHRALRPLRGARDPAEPLYPYQEVAMEYVLEGRAAPWAGGAHSLYLQMGTGLGKSRLGLAAGVHLGGPIFVVAPTKAIREQWLDEARALYPWLACAPYNNPPKKSRKTPPGPGTHDIVVGIVNTVRAKPPGFFAGYATVILDEAHELSSPSNLGALWLGQGAKWVLGISATPEERADGFDRVVHHFLGGPVWAEKDIPRFDIGGVDFRGRVREVEYAGDPDCCETVLSAAGTVSAIETIGNIIRDPGRLRLVAAEVERLYRLHETEADPAPFGLGPREAGEAGEAAPPRRHGIFVFAEHRDYLPALRAVLLARIGAEDLAVPELEGPVVLRGGATRADMGRARRARIVLTTYGYSRRGVSLVDMTAIILATPRRNGMRQILGRVTRRGSDESIVRVVVDIKDVATALKGQSSSRRKIYKEKGYPIARVRVTHADYAEEGAPARPTASEEPVWAPGGPAPDPLGALFPGGA